MEEFWLERYELVTERIGQIKEEQILPEEWQTFFASQARITEVTCEYLAFVQGGGLEKASLKELQEWNKRLFEEEQNVQGECAPLLEIVSAELRSLGILAAQGRLEEFLVRLELFVEIYGICVYEWQEEKRLPDYKNLQECLYWYANDYADMAPLQELQCLQRPEESPVYQLLQKRDLDTENYLYGYGAPVTDRERGLYEWLVRLTSEEVDSWAEQLVEDIWKLIGDSTRIEKGKRILLKYPIGYEKVIYALMKKLQERGLEVVPEVAGTGMLLQLYEKDFTGRKALWDKALAKRLREIRQTITEKAEKENLFSIAKVVLKEEKNEILKPHVV